MTKNTQSTGGVMSGSRVGFRFRTSPLPPTIYNLIPVFFGSAFCGGIIWVFVNKRPTVSGFVVSGCIGLMTYFYCLLEIYDMHTGRGLQE
jgi:hypothetical protein